MKFMVVKARPAAEVSHNSRACSAPAVGPAERDSQLYVGFQPSRFTYSDLSLRQAGAQSGLWVATMPRSWCVQFTGRIRRQS